MAMVSFLPNRRNILPSRLRLLSEMTQEGLGVILHLVQNFSSVTEMHALEFVEEK
jgi:hypothetical protein